MKAWFVLSLSVLLSLVAVPTSGANSPKSPGQAAIQREATQHNSSRTILLRQSEHLALSAPWASECSSGKPALRKQKASVAPLKRKPLEQRPWTLSTSIPLYLAGGGGLLITSIGLVGSLAEPTSANPSNITGSQRQTTPSLAPSPWGILFFGGLSVMASSVSAALWRGYPKSWMAVLGSLIVGGVTASGALMAAIGQDTLTLSMGWGFLASLPVHIIFNIVGWLNVKHHKVIQQQRDKDAEANLSPTRHFRVQVAPSVTSHSAGLQIYGQF